MSEADKGVLWADKKGERYYRIPEGTQLPDGDMLIHDPEGKELRVDALAVEIFEVPSDTLAESLVGDMAAGVSAAGAAFARLAELAARANAKDTSAAAQAVAQRVRDDPNALKDALVEAGKAARVAFAEEGGKAREKFKLDDPETAKAIADAEAKTRKAVDDIGAALLDILRSPEVEQAVRRLGESLMETAESLKADREGDLPN